MPPRLMLFLLGSSIMSFVSQQLLIQGPRFGLGAFVVRGGF
jgi:hypothetical protein